ncbi:MULTISPECIES: phage tail protein I [Ureibacillus]|uniref:Phage tail P2-like protein n=1 Tax=Ureibacillus thermosphaericus TaxID=51173 RepID=A0A840Q0S0_URETH|nr:phage tail protein I [Ureibacillus thermosphaericus]MBB5148666.1 phage tail P2-like protein [Ureibacillus thermosphaericus]NKZ31382.1 phage tail protein I [Ureibacillus thermosphaericus]
MSNLIHLFPQSLQQDDFVVALIEAFEIQVRELYDEFLFFAEKLAKYEFEGLPEELIDYLAYEKHVDFYEDLTFEEKCNVVRNAIEMHRKNGTKYALNRIFDMLNLRGVINEWFEYNGDPYYFRVEILEVSQRGLNQETIELLERLVKTYKNNRSWIEVIKIYLTTHVKENFALTMSSGEELTVYPWMISEIETAAKFKSASGMQTIESLEVYPKGEI